MDRIGLWLRDPRLWIAAAALGSAGLLGGALISQFAFGLAPCEMCIWQRWPHFLAALLGAAALGLGAWRRLMALGGAGLMAVSAGLAAFHVGVERGRWEGVTECSSSLELGGSPEQALAAIMAAPVVRCDQVAWEMLSLSMAGWNGVISAGLLAAWAMAALRAGPGGAEAGPGAGCLRRREMPRAGGA